MTTPDPAAARLAQLMWEVEVAVQMLREKRAALERALQEVKTPPQPTSGAC